jgi:hypothetical protein
MNKLKSGQKLYQDKDGEIIEVEINKVGRKYFTLKNYYSRRKFYIESLRKVTQYGNEGSHFYLSKQEIIDEKEWNECSSILRNFFDRYVSPKKISLDKMKKIIETIGKVIYQ